MRTTQHHITGGVYRLQRQMTLGLLAVLTAFVLFELLRGTSFGSKITGEGDLWNYVSSLLYFMVAEVAILNAILIGRYRRRIPGGLRRRDCMPWAAAGAAFVYFACDEMLGLHEKLGLALEAHIPWVGQHFAGRGDSLVMATMGVGAIVFSVIFLRNRIVSRTARRYFIVAFAMLAVAVISDAAPHGISGFRYLAVVEELLEVYSAALFASAFLAVAMTVVRGVLLSKPVEAPQPVPGQTAAEQSAGIAQTSQATQ